jgi:hypothetical protein
VVLRVGANLRLGVDVLLEEPGGQILPQFAGALLTLVEGDELVLVFGSEHEVEGGGSMAEPALAEFVPLDIGGGLRIVHGSVSRWPRQGTPNVGYPIPTARAQERDCTPTDV